MYLLTNSENDNRETKKGIKGMEYTIIPVEKRRQINIINDIVFSHTKDLEGNEIELKLTLMIANGNSEMRLVMGRDDEGANLKQPVIVWINGNGWRKVPSRTYQAAEAVYLAENGYAVAVVDYRPSGVGVFPACIEDVKCAIRFLRAHADLYNLDVDHIGTIGRSAGGHLSSFCALNDKQYRTPEWDKYSDNIQAAVDFYGPVDVFKMNMSNVLRGEDSTKTREGLMIGGDAAYILETAKKASPVNFISKKMCPIAIFHGDLDPLVPVEQSKDFYDLLQKMGIESDLYIVKGAGHGTKEFVQTNIRNEVLKFFDRHLKKQGE